jgi:peptidoglycan LD-endopeptidase LytH
MRTRWNLIVASLLIAGCASTPPVTAPDTSAATSTSRPPQTTAAPRPPAPTTSSSTLPPVLHYVFPFVGKKVSYARRHHDYPASDVFGCGAFVVAPIDGRIDQTRTTDPWDPKVNDPATRGGKYVSMIGIDGVRYYFAHLASVAVTRGEEVVAGHGLGVMGQTGNARKSACHTHFGISWPCDHDEWAVRRGEIWPWTYLDAWRNDEQLSPVDAIAAAKADQPDACATAILAPSAADA